MSSHVPTMGLEPTLVRKQRILGVYFFTQMVAELVICEEELQSLDSWNQVALVQIPTLLLDFCALVSPSVQWG